MKAKIALSLLMSLACRTLIQAQTARVGTGILYRTLMVKTTHDIGTMFSIDVDNREYWVTAKHLLTGAKHPPIGRVKVKNVSLAVLDPTVPEQKWDSYEFSVLDPGEEIDIVVLAAKRGIQRRPIATLPLTSAGTPIGGECEFLGFPFANSWMARLDNDSRYRMPYIKHCYVSGLMLEPIKVFVLDGINNEGFPGGPVIFGAGDDEKILGVISSYQPEPSDVLSVPLPEPPSGQKSTSTESPKKKNTRRKSVVNLNSGIIFATDANYAIEAIKNNPIGPIIENK
jgi:hypothetical protein